MFPMTKKEEKKYKKQKVATYTKKNSMTCLIRMENEKECRECDPCHCTGKYRGAENSFCNL